MNGGFVFNVSSMNMAESIPVPKIDIRVLRLCHLKKANLCGYLRSKWKGLVRDSPFNSLVRSQSLSSNNEMIIVYAYEKDAFPTLNAICKLYSMTGIWLSRSAFKAMLALVSCSCTLFHSSGNLGTGVS